MIFMGNQHKHICNSSSDLFRYGLFGDGEQKFDRCLLVTVYNVHSTYKINKMRHNAIYRCWDMNKGTMKHIWSNVMFVFIHISLGCRHSINVSTQKNIDYLMVAIWWPFLKVAQNGTPFLMKWIFKKVSPRFLVFLLSMRSFIFLSFFLSLQPVNLD